MKRYKNKKNDLGGIEERRPRNMTRQLNNGPKTARVKYNLTEGC